MHSSRRVGRATRRALISVLAVRPAAARDEFATRAMALRDAATGSGDQPYGALVVRDGVVLGEAESRVVRDTDPTAHAELLAIRAAARWLGSRDLSGAVLYGSSPACAMCRAAAFWAGVSALRHGPDGADGGRPDLPR